MTSAEWWADRAGLDGTVAIITGGAGGLGEAITLDLAANGVRVGLVDRDEDAVARTTCALEGHDAIVRVGDARDPGMLGALFAAVEQRWGRLDTLVNVVGGTFSAPFTEQSPRAWDALMRTNLTHVLHATSLAIPPIRAGGLGGSIISLTTIEAHRAAPNYAVYSAAKAAVANFSRSLAIEVAHEGIRVNCVAPDMVPTPNARLIGGASVPHPMFEPRSVDISIPMGRLGSPSDISHAVVFLASGLSSYITGTTLHPDGGTFASSGWFRWPASGYGNYVPADVLDALPEFE